MNVPTAPSVGHSPHRWIIVTLLVASISGATVLFSSGFASASTGFGAGSTSSSAAVSATEVLGLPVGTAIWALLGFIALVLGMTTVGRSRRRVQHEPASAMAESVAVAA